MINIQNIYIYICPYLFQDGVLNFLMYNILKGANTADKTSRTDSGGNTKNNKEATAHKTTGVIST